MLRATATLLFFDLPLVFELCAIGGRDAWFGVLMANEFCRAGIVIFALFNLHESQTLTADSQQTYGVAFMGFAVAFMGFSVAFFLKNEKQPISRANFDLSQVV